MNGVVRLKLPRMQVLQQGQMLVEPIPQSFPVRRRLLVLAVLRTSPIGIQDLVY
jgi:hypothetical protein